MKVTIKPKNGIPIVKRFSDPKKAIAWINSTTASISAQQKRAADATNPCANFKKAVDGKCYNCGFDEGSHR